MTKSNLPKRPRSHVLEEQSRRAVRAVMPPEWVVRDVSQDYGADLYVEIYRDSAPTGYEFVIQIKATEHIPRRKPLSVRVPWKTVNYLMQRPVAAMIIGYDATSGETYYRWLREYISALEYGSRKGQNKGFLVVHFPPESILSIETASKLGHYFQAAGVSSDRVQELLKAMPSSGAPERYEILQELRFLRSHDGVLYLLSLLPLDLMLENLNMVDVSCLATTGFLEICLTRPTAAATMLFWGVAADIASGEKHSFEDMTRRLFGAMLPKFLEMPPEEVASQSYDLFGWSTEAGINHIRERIRNEQLGMLVRTLSAKLKPLRKAAAASPQARNLYAALYTVEIVDGGIVCLLDSEMEQLWHFYQAGCKHMKTMRANSDDMLRHARGYFEALNQVFGYSFALGHERTEQDVESLLGSMAVKKLDLFLKYVALKERQEASQSANCSQEEQIRFMASDMLTYHKMFWYGRVLDWFGLPCFTRKFLHGGR